jgi:hypothetical protein
MLSAWSEAPSSAMATGHVETDSGQPRRPKTTGKKDSRYTRRKSKGGGGQRGPARTSLETHGRKKSSPIGVQLNNNK